VESRALHVAPGPLDAGRAIEGHAACNFHGEFRGAQNPARHKRQADHGAVCGVGAGLCVRGVGDHVGERETREGQRIVHFADKHRERVVRRLLPRDRHRLVARPFGDAEIGRIDQRKRLLADDVEERAPFALRAAPGDRGVGHEHIIEHEVLRACPAHAERAPCLPDRHALSLERHAEMQHRGAGLRIVVHCTRHREITHRCTVGEDLARAQAETALDFGRDAGAFQSVRTAA
jgi:hypothetical protein